MSTRAQQTELGGQITNLTELIGEMSSEFNSKLDTMNNNFAQWQSEKAEIIEKQSALEARLDQLERREKQKNIVITGLPDCGAVAPKTAVNELFTKQLQLIEVNAIDAFQIKLRSGATKIIASLATMDDKLKVMKAKSLLKGDVFISDDLIKKDQFIQFKVREFAKARRKEGKDAKQGRGRVTVNGETHWWDEAAQRFISRKN